MQKSLTTRLCLLLLVSLFVFQSADLFAEGKFKFGFNERVRNVYFDNLFDYNSGNDDTYHFFRIRTSLWAEAQLIPQLALHVKMTNENRPYLKSPKDVDYTFHETFFDNLYARITLPGKGLTLVAGRQNIILGEGFIMLEGGPWDGSRAIFHDALRMTWKNEKSTLDLMAISNQDVDEWPLINDQDQKLNNTDETAFGAYLTHKLNSLHKVEVYFFNKKEDYATSLTVNTLGARFSQGVNNRMMYATEWAYQMGSQGDTDISAFGGYAYLGYLLQEQKKGMLSVGMNYLSGNDPATADKNEGWNPIFSRWPKWSELYIYSYIPESGNVAYWTNIFSPYLKYDVNIHPKVNLSAAYYLLKAVQNGPFTDGKTRGSDLQLLLKFNFMKNLTGHFLYDYFIPGDFYAGEDGGQFIRGELMYNFSL